jgi:TrkA domain protein
MRDVEETRLPGIGIRLHFTTSAGEQIGVLHHVGGRRELLLYDVDDPDRCRATVRLDDEDARTLADMLGASRLSEQLASLHQLVEGLAIDWLTVRPDWVAVGRTIADLEVRRRTGASIVAVVRQDETIPSPEPDLRFAEGDRVVVVGTLEGIGRAGELLARG